MPRNALTVDVEDYFQVAALEPVIHRREWSRRKCRVEANVDRLLALLDDAGRLATFFTLAWVAERYPALVRRIVAAGHELASHGCDHQRVYEQGRGAFRADVHRARETLEQIGSVPVRGYRAPSFSVDARTPWAAECLWESGYRYSSSVYPVRHDHYGMPEAPRWPHAPTADCALLELPMATARLVGHNLPAAGGGYFRLLPYAVSRRLLRVANHQGLRPIFYLHPWEIDPGQPRLPGLPLRSRFRHYVNLDRTEGRLVRLLRDFDWGRVDRVYTEVLR
ncbi:XrtA system polysaccharide deacetylase [Arhodomonas sp. SL1]|uniref:XrtA system polysaccharide deacetylase n=1 Tax=Arhodomonas sp. SL1 TaxID=3425691 RepID=UPI003F88186F